MTLSFLLFITNQYTIVCDYNSHFNVLNREHNRPLFQPLSRFTTFILFNIYGQYYLPYTRSHAQSCYFFTVFRRKKNVILQVAWCPSVVLFKKKFVFKTMSPIGCCLHFQIRPLFLIECISVKLVPVL